MKTISCLFLSVLSFCLFSCNNNSHLQTLKVAATSVPHAEILEFVKPDLKAEGIDLQILVVEDYNTPNRALADKEVDANFFQHPSFLELQIKDFDYPLEILGAVHIEPMGLYSHKHKKIQDLQDKAKIALPSDPSNQARALKLIEQIGLITLNNKNSLPSVLDIGDNPHGFKFIEIDSPLLTRSLDDVDAAAITTNFALQGGLNPKQAMAIEDSHSDYVNVVVIRKGDHDRTDLKALIKTLQSEKVRNFIEEYYKGAIIPLN